MRSKRIDDGLLVTGVETPWRRQLTNITDLLELNRHFLLETPTACLLHGTALWNRRVFNAPIRLDAAPMWARAVVGPLVYAARRAHRRGRHRPQHPAPGRARPSPPRPLCATRGHAGW
ncbi:MAG: hypothetical protein R2851_24825 [Caldilineaceae bacterium]